MAWMGEHGEKSIRNVTFVRGMWVGERASQPVRVRRDAWWTEPPVAVQGMCGGRIAAGLIPGKWCLCNTKDGPIEVSEASCRSLIGTGPFPCPDDEVERVEKFLEPETFVERGETGQGNRLDLACRAVFLQTNPRQWCYLPPSTLLPPSSPVCWILGLRPTRPPLHHKHSELPYLIYEPLTPTLQHQLANETVGNGAIGSDPPLFEPLKGESRRAPKGTEKHVQYQDP